MLVIILRVVMTLALSIFAKVAVDRKFIKYDSPMITQCITSAHIFS